MSISDRPNLAREKNIFEWDCRSLLGCRPVPMIILISIAGQEVEVRSLGALYIGPLIP